MTNPAKTLSDVQLSIMSALWQIEQGSVAEVLATLTDKSYARTTVATMLTRLEKQAYVVCKKVHGVNVYYPLVEQQAVQQSSISQLLKNFFGDQKSNLVSFLLNEDVSEKELQQVRELLDQKQQKASQSK
ncbi:MAG: BlaI/MecI/CopY family transcriptional regulator [Psychrosphaera sp.]|nr:BlaI/MecI/CopY family transcriptional regulator [Psychrosphaera sp.]